MPLPENVVIIAVNSMVKHELGTSAYRQRVAECEEAVTAIKRKHPEVASLRDVTPEMIGDYIPHRPVSASDMSLDENRRVNEFAAAARNGDLKMMGNCSSHRTEACGDDYQVSCAELDFLVDTAMGIEGVYGARMTGGGFGGCTVNLVAKESTGEFQAKIAGSYERQFNRTPQVYECRPSDGAGEIKP